MGRNSFLLLLLIQLRLCAFQTISENVVEFSIQEIKFKNTTAVSPLSDIDLTFLHCYFQDSNVVISYLHNNVRLKVLNSVIYSDSDLSMTVVDIADNGGVAPRNI